MIQFLVEAGLCVKKIRAGKGPGTMKNYCHI